MSGKIEKRTEKVEMIIEITAIMSRLTGNFTKITKIITERTKMTEGMA